MRIADLEVRPRDDQNEPLLHQEMNGPEVTKVAVTGAGIGKCIDQNEYNLLI